MTNVHGSHWRGRRERSFGEDQGATRLGGNLLLAQPDPGGVRCPLLYPYRPPVLGTMTGRPVRDTPVSLKRKLRECAPVLGCCPHEVPRRHGPQVPELCHLVWAARAIYLRRQ